MSAEDTIREITAKYNPEYAPITGQAFVNGRNRLLPPLIKGKAAYVFPREAAEFLGTSWAGAWSLIKGAEMTAALVDNKGTLTLDREFLEVLRGERLPQPKIVRDYWGRQGRLTKGVGN